MLNFHPDPRALLERAERVIAMGGYNTVSEVLSYPNARALIVPRVEPRREQLIRAERLSALGMFDMCAPDRLSSEEVGRWLGRSWGAPPAASPSLHLYGSARLPRMLQSVIQQDGRACTPTLGGEADRETKQAQIAV